jgi:diguanylate cyclase (GGDEF)-like protein
MVEESSLQVGVSLLRITISVGLVSYPEYSVEQEQTLVKLADQAMYVAKEQGRNMVVEA